MNRLIKYIFFITWKKRLLNESASGWNKKPTYNNIGKVTGWRSAYIDTYGGQRSHSVFLIKIGKYYI